MPPLTLLLALAMVPAPAMASAALVADLEQKLRTNGVESLNAYLGARPADMAALNQAAADCEPQAVDLAVKLARSQNANATKLHNESLRAAAGGCAEFVLSRISLGEVPKVCASVASWTAVQTARELRRRIKEIQTDDKLGASERGKACSAAYLYELQNTRVGIRALPPSSKAR